jgi:hypothetical protein
MTIIRPMWCDDFDMDLPKVFPEALELLGDLADVELWTIGGEYKGTLNHPNVWNGDKTMLAWFGFRGASMPPHYVASGRPVSCTAWEAFRDAWPHSYGMHVEQRPVWDTFALRGQFETLMYQRRGWLEYPPQKIAKARSGVIRSINEAVERLRGLTEHYAGGVRRLELEAPAA